VTDKTSNNFAIEWSEDICDWIMGTAEEQDIEPAVAVYGALAAAVVLARSVGMDDKAIRTQFDEMIENEFPESMVTDSPH
jgi:hypothetical protein